MEKKQMIIMVHNSLGERWLQFEYRNSYFMKEIKFKLEKGTYKSVKISVSSALPVRVRLV